VYTSTSFTTNHKRILIVEDDYDSSLFYKITLEEAGFYVDVYNDPLEALAKFKSNSYVMILIDIRMPILNGFKLFQKIRKKDHKVKVCFMMSFEMYYEAMVEKYPSLRDICFIRKPISRKDLIERVQKVLLE
jgi:DNA-binding response OmpR family regulator